MTPRALALAAALAASFAVPARAAEVQPCDPPQVGVRVFVGEYHAATVCL